MTIKQAIDSSDIDFMSARRILCYILEKEEKYIIINIEEELSESNFKEFIKYVDKLKMGTPLQYITKVQEFMGEDFYVNENVLIPQPDTEVLVEQTILKAQEKIYEKGKATILDLCTGSGAIAISLKKYFEDSIEIYASDISKEALDIANKNATNILQSNQLINFIHSDMFENIDLKFDIIVSNPPYIKTDIISTLSKEVQNEPKIALDGGADGLDFYRIIRENVEKYLNNEGYILMEIGYDQKEEVTNIFENAECIKDYTKNDRVIIWRRMAKNE